MRTTCTGGEFRRIGTFAPSPLQVVLMKFRKFRVDAPTLSADERRRRLCEAFEMLHILHRSGFYQGCENAR